MREWIVSEEELGVDGAYYSGKELVRCKDCKHSRTEELTVKSKVGFLETRIIRFCNKNEMPIAVRADMHFCSWGERKDDE